MENYKIEKHPYKRMDDFNQSQFCFIFHATANSVNSIAKIRIKTASQQITPMSCQDNKSIETFFTLAFYLVSH